MFILTPESAGRMGLADLDWALLGCFKLALPCIRLRSAPGIHFEHGPGYRSSSYLGKLCLWWWQSTRAKAQLSTKLKISAYVRFANVSSARTSNMTDPQVKRWGSLRVRKEVSEYVSQFSITLYAAGNAIIMTAYIVYFYI